MAPESNAPASSTPAPTANTPAPTQIPAGETAASWASVQAGQAKLQEMLKAPAPKGLVPTPQKPAATTPPPVNPELQKANEQRAAEAKANEQTRLAKLTRDQRLREETENRRLELTRKLTDRDGKLTTSERAAATDELRRLVSGQVSQSEREEMLDKLSTSEWRERFGVKNEVQPHLQELWDEDAEAEVLESFSFDGATPQQTQTIMSWYMTKFNQLGGQIEALTPELEVEFRSLAKRVGISQRLADALVANEKKRLA
jgi:hypothetical protein